MGEHTVKLIGIAKWFKIGDVPEANIIPLSPMSLYPPTCDKCGLPMSKHGLLSGEDIICPGDWLLKWSMNKKYFFTRVGFDELRIETRD